MAFQWLIIGAAELIPSSHRDTRPASAVGQSGPFGRAWPPMSGAKATLVKGSNS